MTTFAHAVPLSQITLLSSTPVGPFANGTLIKVCTTGTTTAITLYSDNIRTSTISNPTTVDANGNLTGFADPVDFVDVGLTTGTWMPAKVPLFPAAGDLASLPANVNAVPTSGTAQTIPALTVATDSRIVLTANCTLTFPTPAPGQFFYLTLVQDGTGSRTVTWPAAAKWPSGTAPTLTTTASKRDIFRFKSDGSDWLGFVSGQNY